MWQLLHVSLIFFFSSNFLFKLLSLLIGAHLIGLRSILWMWCNNSAPLPPGDNCVAHKQTDLIETRALTMLPQLTHISILPHIYLSTSECKHYWGTGGRNTRNQLRTKTSCACLAAEYRCGCVSAPPPRWAQAAEDASGSMSSDREEYDMVCQKAVTLIVDICLHNSTLLDQDTCQDFLIVLTGQDSEHKQLGK